MKGIVFLQTSLEIMMLQGFSFAVQGGEREQPSGARRANLESKTRCTVQTFLSSASENRNGRPSLASNVTMYIVACGGMRSFFDSTVRDIRPVIQP
jgi:hypothetical protein